MRQSAEVLEKGANWKSWDYHSKPAWYLYTSDKHYQTHVFLMKESKTKRLSDTSVVHTKGITNSRVTHGDRVVQSATWLAVDIGSFVG